MRPVAFPAKNASLGSFDLMVGCDLSTAKAFNNYQIHICFIFQCLWGHTFAPYMQYIIHVNMINILTCQIFMSTCNLLNVDMQNNLSSISHVEIFMLHVIVFLLHVDIDKSHANIIMLHVGIHLCILSCS